MDDIQILEQKERKVLQTYYKLKYNHHIYTFVDYIYEDSNEPLEAGEYSSIFDNNGSLVENEELKETFGMFVDINRQSRNFFNND